jgi:hypothetical protein
MKSKRGHLHLGQKNSKISKMKNGKEIMEEE